MKSSSKQAGNQRLTVREMCWLALFGALMFGMARKALDPVSMTDVTEPLQFGGLFLVDGSQPEETLSDADRRGASVMRNDVNDKDL